MLLFQGIYVLRYRIDVTARLRHFACIKIYLDLS